MLSSVWAEEWCKKHIDIDPFFVCCIYSHSMSLLICFSMP
ncbi:conserved protein of unknown function [Desulfovibrio sp. 86]|nr:conserved protein of unknown function [Desulfovibrio sp. 86]